MFKYVYVILLAITLTACQQSDAATITLNGTEYSSCPYSVAYTDQNGNIAVTCTNDAGVGIASIGSTVLKKFNTCKYIGVVMYSNGNIQGLCSLSKAAVTPTPAPVSQAKYKGGNRDKNLGTYIDANGMYAWVPMPGV